MNPDPFVRFQELFAAARAGEPQDASAVALGTVGADGRPAVRMVLLKGLDASGFVFFTNYESRKAAELDRPGQVAQAALCFHWPTLQVQVRAEGTVERVSAAESDAYFATRPRGSQLAAWASAQSRPLGGRQELLDRYRHAEERFHGVPVPRPPFWGGYRLLPDRIEFWHGREHRLHERILYARAAGGWTTEHLYP